MDDNRRGHRDVDVEAARPPATAGPPRRGTRAGSASDRKYQGFHEEAAKILAINTNINTTTPVPPARLMAPPLTPYFEADRD